MGEAKAALGIQDDDSAVTVDTIFQMIHGFCRDPLWKIAGGDAVRRPLGEHQLHDWFTPAGKRNGSALIIGVAAAPDK